MKKFLLTTTALTILAGTATAGITVSADGRMGVSSSTALTAVAQTGASLAGQAAFDAAEATYAAAVTTFNASGHTAADDTTLATAATALATATATQAALAGGAVAGAAAATAVEYRFRVHFTGTLETDSGLTAGAKAGLRWDEGESQATVAYGAQAWLGNGTMTVRVGNTGGAIASASGIWSQNTVGFSGMSFGAVGLTWAHTSSSSSGTGPNIVAVDFALGSANVSLSGSQTGDSEIAANFSAGAATIGIGYDTGATTTGGSTLTVGFDAGSANVHANYFQDASGLASWSLGVSMGVGAGTVKGYVASVSGLSSHGIGYSQSLGGGASMGFGYEKAGNGVSTVEAGVSFGF
jgi:hypothetical protein